MKIKLKIRGQVVAVGSYEECMDLVIKRWGWVPLCYSRLLRLEMEKL